MIAEFLSEDEQMSLQQKEEDGARYKGTYESTVNTAKP